MRGITGDAVKYVGKPGLLAETIKLYMAAARWPPRSEPANSHDFLLCISLHNRKSWLFAGSDRGADRAAWIMTAKLNDIDPQAWLADVLARIAGTPTIKLEQLLPWNWQPPKSLRDQAA